MKTSAVRKRQKRSRTKVLKNPITGRTRTITKSGSLLKGTKQKSVSVTGGNKRSKSKTKYGLFKKNKSKAWKCKTRSGRKRRC
jgi:hypothetical protein